VPVLFVNALIFFRISIRTIKKLSPVRNISNNLRSGFPAHPKKINEFSSEKIITIRINGKITPYNWVVCFPARRRINPRPHARDVIINDTGVAGLFHDWTEGSIYSLIILYISNILANSEKTEKYFPRTVNRELLSSSVLITSIRISREMKKTSLLNQLDPRLLMAYMAFEGLLR
jgi:hypothetical protein